MIRVDRFRKTYLMKNTEKKKEKVHIPLPDTQITNFKQSFPKHSDFAGQITVTNSFQLRFSLFWALGMNI